MAGILGALWLGSALVGCGAVNYAQDRLDSPMPLRPVDTGTAPAADDPPRENPWVDTVDEAVSTFSVDVDSGSYTLARRDLLEGRRPDPDAIRVEEFVNYFHYDLARPDDELPFAVTLGAAPTPYGPNGDVHLLQIGIQAEEIPEDERLPVNLVFLLDVSGSMAASDKLGLVVYAMKQLVDKLGPQDTLGIVVYAGASGVVLEPTAVENKSAILDALDALRAGGSTNGEAGITQAYELAEGAFRPEGINRVVLCTDGDFNVGVTGDRLVDVVAGWRDRDIFLTALGFGSGFTQDSFMEQLADQGNGNYGYIDSPNEATRMLGENLVSTLQVVAKDVKVQVEFDPAVVTRWRLVGYENRLLDNEDFADDTVDAGDIGAGHAVVGLYEIEVPDLAAKGPLADVRLRYKEPTSDVSELIERTIATSEASATFAEAPGDLRFAAGVAEFAEVLRESVHSDGTDLAALRDQIAGAREVLDASETELLELIDAAAKPLP